ncbi:MAG: anthranilate phosphoribosyltransferase [Pirellulales bacterium]
MSDLADFTARLQLGASLSQDEMSTAVLAMMEGRCNDDSIAQFLLTLRAKGESVDEVAGAAAAMRRHMQPIRSQRSNLLDTCGTGGDGSQTFNISTATALVTAAAGQPVAKHGNRSMSSRSGSADVLRELGVNVEATREQVERSLDELGICFCYAPMLHPSMRHVSAVRRSLGVPTIFNLLGPLCNPAGAPYQLLGVGRTGVRLLIAEALQRLGTRRAVVVCGTDGLDEVTLAADTLVSEVTSSGRQEIVWNPAQFGFAMQSLESLKVDGPEQSAAMIRGVLSGEPGPARDIVLINAAAALLTTGHSTDRAEAVAAVADAVDSGAARRLLGELARLSQG